MYLSLKKSSGEGVDDVDWWMGGLVEAKRFSLVVIMDGRLVNLDNI